MSIKRKIILTFTMFSSATCGLVIAAMPPSGPAEAWTITQITELVTESVANIVSFGTTLSLDISNKFENLIKGVAIATKQESTSAQQVSNSINKSSQTLIEAIKMDKQAANVVDAKLNYSPVSGQGFEPAQTHYRNHTLSDAFVESSRTTANEVMNMDIDNRPGFVVKSKADAMAKRLKQHRSLFCTKAEADQNLCTLSEKLAGADTNAAYLFKSSAKDTDEDKARQAYIQHILGEPDEPVSGNLKDNAESKANFVQKIRKDALTSIPAYSLQSIRIANMQSDAYQNYSPNELLHARVNQYFGGEEAKKWAGTLAGQTERGLLVEALKMHGLETWLHQRQYQQNQRLEANLAALLLINSQHKQQQLQKQYTQLTNQIKN
jgi:hypothetical protein